MNIWYLVISIVAISALAVGLRVGRELAIRDLHIAAGKRLTRSEHRQMGQLMDKALNEDETN